MAVLYDTASAGASGVNTSGGVAAGTPISISAASGADVIFALQLAAGAVTGAPTNVQCNGSAATLVDSQSADNLGDSAGTYLYRAAGAGTGSSISITYSIPNSTWYVAGAVSATGVGSVSLATKAFGVGTAVSSGSIFLAAGQLAICAYGSGFGAAHVMSLPTGGTNQYLATTPGTAGEANLAISTSTTTATFGATNAASLQWSSVAIVLSIPAGIPGPGGNASATVIPNRRVGPMALRRRKRLPQVGHRRTGLARPVEYDATGTGYCNAFNGATASWLHQARSGAYVVAVVHGYFNQDTYGTFGGVTYGGLAMTPLYTVYNENAIVAGAMTVFGLANAPPGQQTVTVALASSHLAIIVGNTFSYTGVASVSAFAWPAYGGGTPAFTLAITNPANSIALAALASSVGQLSALSGGDIRHNASYILGGGALAVMDTTNPGAATFSATPPSAANWSGVGMILSPLPAPTYPPAMTGALAKFALRQNVSFFVIGDSTTFGLDDLQNLNGWVGRLGILFGLYYDYNVVLRQYNPGSDIYNAPTTLHTSPHGTSAPTLTIYAGTVSGTYASGDIIAILSGNLVPISNPDFILIGTGINDTFFQTLSPAEYTVEMNMLLGYLTNSYCPGVPVIVTTQNPVGGAFDFPTLSANYSAMAQSLVGSTTPLGAGLVQGSNNNVSVLDTLQAYQYQHQMSLFAGANPDEHPNQWGYAVQAYWMASVLAPWIVTAIGAKMPPLRVPNSRVGPMALRNRKRETQIVRRWAPNNYTGTADSTWTLDTVFPVPLKKLVLSAAGNLILDASGAAVTSSQG